MATSSYAVAGSAEPAVAASSRPAVHAGEVATADESARGTRKSEESSGRQQPEVVPPDEAPSLNEAAQSRMYFRLLGTSGASYDSPSSPPGAVTLTAVQVWPPSALRSTAHGWYLLIAAKHGACSTTRGSVPLNPRGAET